MAKCRYCGLETGSQFELCDSYACGIESNEEDMKQFDQVSLREHIAKGTKEGKSVYENGDKMTYCVITKVPDPSDSGNLAMALGQVFLDPQTNGGKLGDKPIPLGEALNNKMLELYIQIPVFKLGELLLLDAYERDQFGRKPSKWFIEYEVFYDIKEAVARVREVTSE